MHTFCFVHKTSLLPSLCLMVNFWGNQSMIVCIIHIDEHQKLVETLMGTSADSLDLLMGPLLLCDMLFMVFWTSPCLLPGPPIWRCFSPPIHSQSISGLWSLVKPHWGWLRLPWWGSGPWGPGCRTSGWVFTSGHPPAVVLARLGMTSALGSSWESQWC